MANHSLTEPFNNDHFESLPHAACVTLFHRNGRVGCGTYGHEVMTGRLLDWNSVVGTNDNNNEEGRRRVEEKQSIPPYVAVIDEEYYTADNVAKLMYYSSQYTAGNEYGVVEEGGPLRGVLVLASSSTSTTTSNINDNNGVKFPSPEPLCPQGQNTPSAELSVGTSYAWNVNNMGEDVVLDGLTNTDMYGLPTAYVYDGSTASYLKSVSMEQANALNSGSSNNVEAEVYPAILSEFNNYMGPGGETDANGNAVYNSQKCLEWKDTKDEWSPRCAPLGGNSIWSVAGSPVPLEYGGGDNKPTVLIATNIDSTSMFHDIVPGANTAASNILTVLMAAQLLGSSVTDETLDALYGRITFAFFQGESYGYIGSRRFIKDLQEFECTAGNEGVPNVYKRKDEATTARACSHPLRQDLTFQNLGEIRGMIAVDQVGNLGGTKNMYVQGGEKTDNGAGFASFLSEVMIELSASDSAGYTASASSVEDQDEEDGSTPIPPSPLSSLVQSNDAIGGVVLTGYDEAFIANSLYHSHLDSASSEYQTIDKDAIASAATLVARSAVAAAYQNANDEVDAETAAAYALELLPTAIDSSSDTFTNLYICLFIDGNCDTLVNYGAVESRNDANRIGKEYGIGQSLGKPPNYYTSIYDANNGQAFVVASGKYYGSLIGGEEDEKGEIIKSYGEDDKDFFAVRPSLLEMSIFGLLNDYLGRGSFVASEEEGVDSTTPKLTSCKSSGDCSSVSYCNTETSALTLPTCAGGSCVCGSRSHYHLALDEALEAATNRKPAFFSIQDDDEGISALYTEPYWSSNVGVRIYNDAGNNPGVYAASVGAVFSLFCIGFVWRLKKTMVKEKVY